MAKQRRTRVPVSRTDPFAEKMNPVIAGLSKPTNPKNGAAIHKAPIMGVPTIALVWYGIAAEDGKQKYGPFNWRDAGASFEVYMNAIFRHWCKVREGEWLDPTSPGGKVPHLAYLMTGAGLLLDAHETGQMVGMVGTTAPEALQHVMDQVALAMKELEARYANQA